MEHVPFMDQSGLYALEAAVEGLHKQKVIVALSGPNEQAMKMLRNMNIVPHQISDEHVFSEFSDCSQWLRELLEKEDGLGEEWKLLQEKLIK